MGFHVCKNNVNNVCIYLFMHTRVFSTTHGHAYHTNTHIKQVRYSFTGSLGQGGSDLGTWVEQQGGFTCVLTGMRVHAYFCMCPHNIKRTHHSTCLTSVLYRIMLHQGPLLSRRIFGIYCTFLNNVLNLTTLSQGPLLSLRMLCIKAPERLYSSTSQG
jgi:hypothetical protein